MENSRHATLGPVSLGIALGIIWAATTMVLGLIAALLGWGVLIVQVLSSLYVGYSPSIIGIISGGVWGFADGFVFGFLVAWLYNRLILRRQRHMD